ncbi:MAG: alpha/beta hydrolase [Chloroflexota bacterium]
MGPRESQSSPDAVPYSDFGGTGRDVTFLHANGYPRGCYSPLLRALATQNHTLAMLMRPLWPGSRPEAIYSWHVLSDDFLRFLTERGLRRVIAIGHSLGAIVALRAALAAPDRFSALVLLEPVLMSKGRIRAWRLLRAVGAGHRLHAKMRGAHARRRVFPDLEQAFQAYRRHAVFRHFTDAGLRALIDGLTAPAAGGGYRLIYSPEWEARVYYTGVWNDWDLWNGIPALPVPTLLIRGAESDTFEDVACRAVQSANPRIRSQTVANATHLVPLEQPSEVIDVVQQFLEDAGEAPAMAPAPSSRGNIA